MSGMTLAEAADHITSTDPLFAVGEAEIRGVTLPVFTNIPRSLRELQQYGREDHRNWGRCFDVRIGEPGVYGHTWNFERKADKQHQKREVARFHAEQGSCACRFL